MPHLKEPTFGKALTYRTSQLHSSVDNKRAYAMNWTEGGGLDDELDQENDDDLLDSYAHVAGRFQASSSSQFAVFG